MTRILACAKQSKKPVVGSAAGGYRITDQASIFPLCLSRFALCADARYSEELAGQTSLSALNSATPFLTATVQ